MGPFACAVGFKYDRFNPKTFPQITGGIMIQSAIVNSKLRNGVTLGTGGQSKVGCYSGFIMKIFYFFLPFQIFVLDICVGLEAAVCLKGANNLKTQLCPGRIKH